jgi:transmembrane sensor
MIPVEIDNTLIAKYLAGEAEPEEAIALENWLAAAKENKQLFEQYLDTWKNLYAGESYWLPEKALVWEQLTKKISEENRKPVPRIKKYNWLRIAAGIAAIVLLSAITWFISNQTISGSTPRLSVIETTSEFKRDSLPDGSFVIVNSNSKLSYPQQFNPVERKINLDGEAFFKVKHDEQQPFLVNIDNITIKVLGTSFNIRRINNRDEIETQVHSGVVRMFNNDSGIIIKAGQTGIYTKSTNQFIVRNELDINSLAYATRVFAFNNTSLEDIIRYLEKTYSTTIRLENKKLAGCKMSSSFDNKPIEYILDVIAATLNIQYTIKNGIIYINGTGSC